MITNLQGSPAISHFELRVNLQLFQLKLLSNHISSKPSAQLLILYESKNNAKKIELYQNYNIISVHLKINSMHLLIRSEKIEHYVNLLKIIHK